MVHIMSLFGFGKKKKSAPAQQPDYESYTPEQLYQAALSAEKNAEHDLMMYLAEMASERGYAPAQYKYACLLSQYSDEDRQEAFELFMKLAKQGNTDAQFHCGELLYEGDSVTGDKAAALKWYEKAAEKGHPESQLRCGEMYLKGEGTQEDKAKALTWFEKSAEQDEFYAKINCAKMYDEGVGTAVDKAKALMWFESAAGQEHIAVSFKRDRMTAQLKCALMYYDGDGTAANKRKALMWFEKVAEQGFSQAQLKCGEMYNVGEGTEPDKAKALMWFEKAAEQGEEKAISALAALKGQKQKPQPSPASEQDRENDELQLIFDKGMEAYNAGEYKKALSLFEKAAKKGHSDSQYYCGVLYEEWKAAESEDGWDEGEALVQAYEWYEAAAQQGNTQAMKAANNLRDILF